MNPYPNVMPEWAPPQQAVEPPPRVVPLQFTGSASEYFRIWIVNTLLSIVTLGIYSAWAKVRRQQYFYRHTWIEGASFEYLADPIKILKGRLIIGAFLISLGVSQQYSPVVYLVLLLVFVAATPWLMVKALAFNAKNSAFRNVRFAFTGTTSETYGLYFGMMALYMVSCGLAYPYVQWRMTRFIARRHYYGDLSFNWLSRATDYFRVYLVAMAAILPAYGLLLWFMIANNPAFKNRGAGAGGAQYADAPDPYLMAGAFFLGYLYLLIPAAYLRARLANLVYGGLALDRHTFSANQRARDLLVIYATNVFAIVFSLGLLIPWAQIRLARYRAEHLTINARGPLDVMSLGLGGGRSALGDAATDLGDLDLGIGV